MFSSHNQVNLLSINNFSGVVNSLINDFNDNNEQLIEFLCHDACTYATCVIELRQASV
jgi:hypothetical protein